MGTENDLPGISLKDEQRQLQNIIGIAQDNLDLSLIHIYAISKMLQVPMDSIVCGNAGRTKSQMDACLTDQERSCLLYTSRCV